MAYLKHLLCLHQTLLEAYMVFQFSMAAIVPICALVMDIQSVRITHKLPHGSD